MTAKKDAKKRKRERRKNNRRKAQLGKEKSGQVLLLEKVKKSKYLDYQFSGSGKGRRLDVASTLSP